MILQKYAAHLALIALAVGAFLYLQARDADVRKHERQACQNEQLSADAQGVRTNASKANEIKRLDDPDLDRRLRNWLQR